MQASPCFSAARAIAIALVWLEVAAAVRLDSWRHRKGNIFQLLLEDYEASPSDPAKFEASCSKLIGKLLPELRREYTSRQVPTVLYHECDLHRTRDDFHKDNITKEMAGWQCQHFSGTLVNEFFGKKNYAGWCQSFFQYLQEVRKPASEREAERHRLLDEKQDLQDQLDDLRTAQLRKIEKAANKSASDETDIRDELDRLTEDLKNASLSEPGSSGFDDVEAHKLSETLDGLEEDWDELNPDDDDDAPCCPDNCRICHVDQEAEHEVEAEDARPKKASPAKKTKKAASNFLDVTPSHAKKKRGVHVDFFHSLILRFTELPDKDSFVQNCSGVIGGLLPKLQHEYTWQMVPSVLDHDCDVYTTTTDFQQSKATLEHARWNCRHFAGQLAEEFRGKNPQYPRWCSKVYTFLALELKENKTKSHVNERQKLLKEKKQIQKQLDKLHAQLELTIPCCPSDCRDCSED